MHSFDLYCTALHSCVCIVQIILCILVHCALRLTMANYSHCRQHASTGAPFQAVKQWEASPNAPSRLTVGIPQPGRGGDSLKICQNQNLNVFMVKCEEKWPLSWIWQREILQFQFNTQFARAISLRDQPSMLKCFCQSSFLRPTPILCLLIEIKSRQLDFQKKRIHVKSNAKVQVQRKSSYFILSESRSGRLECLGGK